MSMHYDSESLVDRGQSPRLFALLVNNNRLVIQIYRINTILYIFCILDFLKKLQNSNPYKIYGIIIWN